MLRTSLVVDQLRVCGLRPLVGLRPAGALGVELGVSQVQVVGLRPAGALGVEHGHFILTVYATHTRTSSCRYELSRPIAAP